VAFNYLGQLDQTVAAETLYAGTGESSGRSQSEEWERPYAIEVSGSVRGGRLRLSWSYSREQLARERMEELAARYEAELRGLIAHCRSAGAGGYTPSDFPLARLSREELARAVWEREGIADLYPLSPLQQGMLYHSLQDRSGVLFEQSSYVVEAELDYATFVRAWQRVVERHGVLRTSFIWEGVPQPLQKVHQRVELPVRQEDWRALEAAAQEQRLAELLRADREAGFELGTAPLMRLQVVRLGEQRYQLVWSHHHLLLDGWCLSLLLKEVFSYYEAERQGVAVQLEGSRPYREYIGWLQRQDLGAAEQYWRRRLAGFRQATRLPLLGGSQRASGAVRRYGSRVLRLDRVRTEQLRRQAQQQQLTLNTMVAGAWALLLSHYAGEPEVVFGATVSGRPAELPGVERMVGPFINTLPVRVAVAAETAAGPWLQDLQAQLVELRQYEYSPLVQQWSEVGLGAELFETLLVYENYPVEAEVQQQAQQLRVHKGGSEVRTKYALTLVVGSGAELVLYLAYERGRYGAAEAERLLAEVAAVLEGLGRGAAHGLGELLAAAAVGPAVVVAAAEADEDEEEAEPGTELQEQVRRVMQTVLGGKRLRLAENFFERGGHSLLAMQLLTRVRQEFGVEIAIGKVFEQPTIGGIAALIAAAGGNGAGPERLPRRRESGPAPLSPAQQRLWFLEQLEPGNPFYNSAVAVRLEGELQLPTLQQTLNEIVRRHEVLRTSFARVHGEPVQLVHEAEAVALPVVELSEWAEAEREAEVRRQAAAEAATAFSLSSWPLLRVKLLRLGATEHVVLLTMHHIVSDAWSMGIFINEVAVLYAAYAQGQPSPLAELELQYSDYAQWQRDWLQGAVLEQQLRYWRQQLSGRLPLLELPADRERPAQPSYRGSRYSFSLEPQLSERLKQLSQAAGATLYMTLLAGFQTLLYRYTGETDVVVGSVVANRSRAEVEGLIGFFVNTLVLRVDLSGEPSFREVLRRVREVCLGAYAHQEVPFEKLVEELQPEREGSRSPLFQVTFGLQNAPRGTLQLPGLQLRPVSFENEAVRFDLTLWMVESAHGLSGAWAYNKDLYRPERIARMQAHFATLLAHLSRDPDTRISQLEMLAEAEKEELAIRKKQRQEANRKKLKAIKRNIETHS
jgi:non-ribosomal peptide synthase protein (TIGR01720 family)